jgi:hypothetical protein
MNRVEFYNAFEALKEIHITGYPSNLIYKVSGTDLNIVADIISKYNLFNEDFFIPYEKYYDFFILDAPLELCM